MPLPATPENRIEQLAAEERTRRAHYAWPESEVCNLPFEIQRWHGWTYTSGNGARLRMRPVATAGKFLEIRVLLPPLD